MRRSSLRLTSIRYLTDASPTNEGTSGYRPDFRTNPSALRSTGSRNSIECYPIKGVNDYGVKKRYNGFRIIITTSRHANAGCQPCRHSMLYPPWCILIC